MATIFSLGGQFNSFDALQSAIHKYEGQNFVQLWTCHSRTIAGAQKRGVRREIRPSLKYYEIEYKCIHGGTWKSRSTGKRPDQRSYRQQCPFALRMKASSDGNFIEVVHLVDSHNHVHSKETYSFLPRQRQLDAPAKELTKHMLQLRANKKLVQAELLASKKVSLKDLHNLSTSRNTNEEDTLENALNYLTKKESAIIEMVRNEENILMGIFYQDDDMKTTFHSYPEVLFVGAIHKVSNRRTPLYIFAVEDSNGESEIVSFFLASFEDKTTITEMVKIFKKHNPSWSKIKSIMTDKDFQERNAFHQEIPDAALLICLFQTLRTFRKEITTEKMGITSGERDKCLEIVQNMAYAKNETDYENNFQKLQETGLKPVIDYMKTNWDVIKNEWVISLQNVLTLGNRTNNRLEALNSKVIQVVKRNSSLSTLFKDLDNLMLSLRMERDNRAAQAQLKVAINVPTSCEEQKKYLQILTPYAYGFVAEKFKQKALVKLEGDFEEVIQIKSSAGILHVSPNRCSCAFFLTMELPCHHILKVREVKQMSLFSHSLFSKRWTKIYYLNNSSLTNQPTQTRIACTLNKVHSARVLSQNEKFRIVSDKVQTITSLASEAPSRIFPQRLKALDTLISFWQENCEINITAVSGTEQSQEKVVLNPEISLEEEQLNQEISLEEAPLDQKISLEIAPLD